MALGSSLRWSADVPSAELFEVEELPPEAMFPAHRPFLPLHTAPLPGEALPSWLFRFCAPFGLSPASLLRGLELGEVEWWRHPTDDVIALTAGRTGLAEDQLRAMTFAAWTPDPLADLITERFARDRLRRTRPAARLSGRSSVCPECIAEDETPHIRKAWQLGWLAACPIHRSVLLTECPECHAKLRMPPTFSRTFAPDRCGRCGLRFARVRRQPALELVTDLQDALILGRASGTVILPGLGSLPWTLTMALFDVLLGMVWIGTKAHGRQVFLNAIAKEIDCPDLGEEPQGSNYEGLLILAWLLDRWPSRFPLAFARLRAVRVRHQLDRWPHLTKETRADLERLLVPAGPDDRYHPDRGAGLHWLNSLPETEADLRAMAVAERAPDRRIRLHALANLRTGMGVVEAAKIASVGAPTVYRWLRQGASGGLKALLVVRGDTNLRRGPAAEIGAWLALHPLNNGRWKADHLQRAVLDHFGVEITRHAALDLLKRYKPRGRRSRRPTPRILSPAPPPVAD